MHARLSIEDTPRCDAGRRIEADGWQAVRQTGSHRHLRHPTKPGTVTVSRALAARGSV
jgi:predicted RNA binding protein YcfA (HicA-like mRNA interferase family)